MKIKKKFLIFLVFYLMALALGRDLLLKIWSVLWDLAPSQTFNWCFISGIELVILLIIVFILVYKVVQTIEYRIHAMFLNS
jgi:hypothetical protein